LTLISNQMQGTTIRNKIRLFVQLKKNRAYHSATKKLVYETHLRYQTLF